MDFYLTQDGQRRGPFLIFQVKDMLESGAARPTDLGWHSGLSEWQPLEEIDALSSFLPRTAPPPLPSFEEPEMVPPPPQADTVEEEATAPFRSAAPAVEEVEAPSFQPTELPLTRWELFSRRALPRFLARSFDTSVFFAFTTGVAVLTQLLPPNTFVFPPFWFVPAQALGWVFVEAWMLSRYATTPGKWLFNITVEHPEEGVPSFGRALKRSFFIWVCAWGLGFPNWAFFGSAVALMLYLQSGRMVWDFLVGTEVVHRPARPARWVVPAVFFAGYWITWLTIFFTQPWPDWVGEEQRRQLEELKTRIREAGQPPSSGGR